MSKATRILNEYQIKELILRGNPQYENFYKEELIEFCKISKQEIERLNNIINELEKEIISQIEICKEGQVLEAKVRSPFDTYSGDIRAYKYLLYKLKELKDSD